MHPVVRLAAAALLVGTCANAQTAFDSASLKPAQSGARGYSLQPLPGRLSGKNVSLKQLIAAAWSVHDFQVEGGPKWIDADRYDLEAKAPNFATPPGEKQLMGMLRQLLAERFQLQTAEETKEQQVYVLSAGKGGLKAQHTKDTTEAVVFRVLQRHQVTSRNAPLEHLVETLAWILGRPVVDRTGLQGPLDYDLEWSPDDTQLRSAESPVTGEGSLPSLAGALQERLGIRLASERGPVPLIVVERAEKPAAN